MKEEQSWRPTKFVFGRDGRPRASPDKREVYPGSRFAADLFAKKFFPHIQNYARGVLVDLGCGKAPLYGAYKNYADEFICVDWAQSRHDNPHIDVFQDLNEPLELDSDMADTVILTSVLEHIYRPAQLLDEIFRILKPSGRLIMSVPFHYWLHEAPHDYFRYTRYFFETYCQENNHDIIVLEETGGAPEIMIDIACKLSAQIPVVGGAACSFLGFLMKVYPAGMISEKSKMKFPFGYIAVIQKR